MDLSIKYLHELIHGTGSLATAVTVLLAVLGWIVALLLQRRNIRHQHQVDIKYDVYKQFVEIYKQIQEHQAKLSASAYAPLISMDISMIPFTLGLMREQNGTWVPWTELECVFEGRKKWTAYVNDLQALNSELNRRYGELVYLFGAWNAALKPLLKSKETLLIQTGRLQKRIRIQLDVLQMYTIKNGDDWRKWNPNAVDDITASISEDAREAASYLSDFMVLIHNQLLSRYFWQKLPTRRTLDAKYKVLTAQGIIENVDWRKVRVMEQYLARLKEAASNRLRKVETNNGSITAEYKGYLEKVFAGICSECSNPIQVVNIEDSPSQVSFDYICGHGCVFAGGIDHPSRSRLTFQILKGWLGK